MRAPDNDRKPHQNKPLTTIRPPRYLGAMETLADRLRYARGVRGLNQRQLAEMCGVTQAAIWKWENGTAPTAPYVRAMSLELRVSADWLLGAKRRSRWFAP